MSGKSIVELLKAAYAGWQEDKASRLAAAMAYYAVISLAPLLIIVTALVALIFGEQAAQGQIAAQIQQYVGERGAQAIQSVIAQANNPTTGGIASVLAIATLLFGASGVFDALQDGLNTIWKVTPKPGRGVTGILRARLVSLLMVLGIGLVLLLSLALSATIVTLSRYFGDLLPLPAYVFQVANFIASFGVITLLFAMIYKLLPEAEIAWRDVWFGAAMTALLFTVGNFLIGLYLGRSTVGSAYGAAGSLIVILVWVYYSAQVVFFGAEFTRVYANRYGERIKPSKDAVPDGAYHTTSRK